MLFDSWKVEVCCQKRSRGASGGEAQGLEGLVETSPGVRSCMVEYDQRRLSLTVLLDHLIKIEKSLPAVSSRTRAPPLLPRPCWFKTFSFFYKTSVSHQNAKNGISVSLTDQLLRTSTPMAVSRCLYVF